MHMGGNWFSEQQEEQAQRGRAAHARRQGHTLPQQRLLLTATRT